jgi:hypothetical protein
MKRVEEDGDWSLMCPDKSPNLYLKYGEEFEKLYIQYETEGRALKIVKARTGAELTGALTDLRTAQGDLELQRNAPNSGRVAIISIRNDFAQNNYRVTNPDGTTDLVNSVLQQYPNGLTSDAAWMAFLKNSIKLEAGPNGTVEVLEIPFSVTLDRPFGASQLAADGKQRTNQFFSPTRYGDLINYNSPSALGVQVMMTVRSVLAFPPLSGEVTANLRMEGSSQIRSQPWLNELSETGIRTWNLQPASDEMTVSFNDYGSQGNPLLHGRSPANDRWVLKIYNTTANSGKLFTEIKKSPISSPLVITDIGIKFHLRGFIRQ